MFHFSWVCTKKWDFRSHGDSMFKLMRKYQVVFQSGCTIFYSQQSWTKVPIAPGSCRHLWLSVSAVTAILTGGQWCLAVFWFAFPGWPRMSSVFSHLLWGNCLFTPSAHPFLGFVVFWCVVGVLPNISLFTHTLCKHFTSWREFSYFIDGNLWNTQKLYFVKAQLVYIFSFVACALYFGCHLWETAA